MLKARKLVDVGFAVLVYRSAHTMYLYRYIVANYGYNERYT
mgnify:CR=1 FL=1